MDNLILLEMATVLVAWSVTGYAIWKWGPGLRKRRVRCPEKKVKATVLAEQREAEFGCLTVADVHACSLLAGSPATCGKTCLARF
jgi:hypothetical protein